MDTLHNTYSYLTSWNECTAHIHANHVTCQNYPTHRFGVSLIIDHPHNNSEVIICERAEGGNSSCQPIALRTSFGVLRVRLPIIMFLFVKGSLLPFRSSDMPPKKDALRLSYTEFSMPLPIKTNQTSSESQKILVDAFDDDNEGDVGDDNSDTSSVSNGSIGDATSQNLSTLSMLE